MQINNSQNKPYYTQRNNEIKPGSACNVTSMIAALAAAGWPVDRLSDSRHSQPEDALMFFLNNDKSVRDAWMKVDPAGRYPPNEWHPVLAYGTNLFLRHKGLLGEDADAVEFSERRSLSQFIRAIDSGGACVTSGLFTFRNRKVCGHVVAVVGYRTDEDGNTVSLIIDDPWGDYRTYYESVRGNDIEMPLADFKRIIRPAGQDTKIGHIIMKFIGGIE